MQNIAKSWFFIRYADPEPHIRLRLNVSNVEFIGTVISCLSGNLNYLVQQGVIHKIQMDTYVRELERYGREHIINAERLFGIDSRCIVNILRGISDEYMRGLVAFKLVDSIFSAFGLDTLRKRDLASICSEGFKSEFGYDDHNANIFNREYRPYQNVIRDVIESKITDDCMKKLSHIVDRYYKDEGTAKLINGMFSQKNTVSKDDFLRSYVHMSLNRLFCCENRKQEMVVYEYMYRYYKSAIIRGNVVDKK